MHCQQGQQFYAYTSCCCERHRLSLICITAASVTLSGCNRVSSVTLTDCRAVTCAAQEPQCCCCRVVEELGPQHQPDICSEDCTAQHRYFYIRLQPSVSSVSVKPGCTRKRRLDLKVDLSHQHRVASFDQLLQLTHAQLEVRFARMTCCFLYKRHTLAWPAISVGLPQLIKSFLGCTSFGQGTDEAL